MALRPFATHLLNVSGEQAEVTAPVPWQGRVNEGQLEEFIVERPELAGENLIVLGSQLREFQEDLDRLDVLALDEDGEIVLMELKVTEDFRVTDLQALAYAAAYANKDGEHFASTLQRWRNQRAEKTGEQTITLGDANAVIADFLGLDEFEAWEPSQHVRIKLIAPAFPRRVLATVKWLGDLYGVRVEAIRVQLFESAEGSFQLAFERLLPLPGAEEFDLTVRQRESRKRDENTSRRPDVVKFLFERGQLPHGKMLWLDRAVLPPAVRDQFDPAKHLFQVTVDASDGNPKFRWRAGPDDEAELLSPSTVPYHVLTRLVPDQQFRQYRSVHDKFTVEPGGETLGAVAEKHGWTGAVSNGAAVT